MAILTPAPANFSQKIRSQLTEGLQLGYADIIPSVLHLRATMAGTGGPPATTLPEDGTDIYRVSGDYNFLIAEVRGHIALNAIGSEDAQAATGFAGMMLDATVRGRIAAKALNAKVSLFNPDRNDLRFVENSIQNSSAPNTAIVSNLSLASIMPVAGGSPIKLIEGNRILPLIVPGSERLQLKVSLRNAAASSFQTEYGLVLTGALVRMRAG